MSNQKIRELEQKIAEIKRRIPPHSVSPSMIYELEELEEELEKARAAEGDQDQDTTSKKGPR
jgi:hypothetical protein